ncbi:MAG: hypothetical protein QOE90_2269 [Thermoplasmata archaeon]|jgi:uncharacterized protein (DUF488 family)|nr:hypothetical protein [Thermoplasmata archaeon]
MEIATIGFTKKSAEEFFERLKRAGIRQLVDVRLNNVSQLAGFAKKDDLRYFLREICDAEYVHEPLLAPTQTLLDAYKKEGEAWPAYEKRFLALMAERKVEERIPRSLFDVPTVLLCSEDKPHHCHRRLVVDHLAQKWGPIAVRHL